MRIIYQMKRHQDILAEYAGYKRAALYLCLLGVLQTLICWWAGAIPPALFGLLVYGRRHSSVVEAASSFVEIQRARSGMTDDSGDLL